jgi:hypothetical protein
MIDVDEADAFDAALSHDAIRKAAKDGEQAAQTLLVLAEGLPDGELAALAKQATRMSSGEPLKAGDAETMKYIRRMIAHAMSHAVLDAANKKIRKTARRYLESNDMSPGEAGVRIALIPFAEAKEIAAKAKGDAFGDKALRDFFAGLKSGKPHCMSCGQSFSPEPHEVAFCNGALDNDTAGAMVGGLCAACAAAPEEIKMSRVSEALMKGIKDRTPTFATHDVMPFVRSSGVISDLIAAAEAFVRAALIGKPNAQLFPHWLLQRDGETDLGLVETAWSDEAGKRAALGHMHGFMRDNGVTAYACASEVWFTPTAGSNVRPSQSDQRREAVNIVVSDGDVKQAKILAIVRDADGVCTDLRKIDGYDGPVKGPMAEMLD